MDAGRSAELTDAAVDHELQALFAVDPSPEFVARVQARVSGEPLRGDGGGRRSRWQPAASRWPSSPRSCSFKRARPSLSWAG
jgi:hypothetical protein